MSATAASVSVRLANAADVDRIVDLAAAFRDDLELPGPADDEMRHRLPALLFEAATEFLLAEDDDGNALGFLQIRYRDSLWYGGDAEVEDLFVVASARRRGVGRQLLSHALERARTRGCRHLGLNTNENNAAALVLYGSFGLDGRRRRWQGGRQVWIDREI